MLNTLSLEIKNSIIPSLCLIVIYPNLIASPQKLLELRRERAPHNLSCLHTYYHIYFCMSSHLHLLRRKLWKYSFSSSQPINTERLLRGRCCAQHCEHSSEPQTLTLPSQNLQHRRGFKDDRPGQQYLQITQSKDNKQESEVLNNYEAILNVIREYFGLIGTTFQKR